MSREVLPWKRPRKRRLRSREPCSCSLMRNASDSRSLLRSTSGLKKRSYRKNELTIVCKKKWRSSARL